MSFKLSAIEGGKDLCRNIEVKDEIEKTNFSLVEVEGLKKKEEEVKMI